VKIHSITHIYIKGDDISSISFTVKDIIGDACCLHESLIQTIEDAFTLGRVTDEEGRGWQTGPVEVAGAGGVEAGGGGRAVAPEKEEG